MSNPFRSTADQFTPTKWESAEDKATFVNKLLEFIAAGFPERKFTQKLYERLSGCFMFIAQYDRNGFMATHLSSTAAKLEFLKQIASSPCFGDPTWTYSDAELVVREAVRSLGLVSVYETKVAQEEEVRERNMLALLLEKYQNLPDQEPSSARFPVASAAHIPVAQGPAQFALFG